jgi:GTP-binding protein
MQFVDQVEIEVKSGDGGNGIVAFRREKFVPRGGPDGGDGGRGGHIIFKATDALNTLLDQIYHREYRAQRGQHGMGKKMHGKNGEDLIIPVPVGTILKDGGTEDVLIDLDRNGLEVVIAKAGRGGLGNSHFASPARQAPRYAQPGEEGDEKFLILELKLLADVGLIGLPNAGKSTLLSVISSAKPKIADYPFTTLKPILGVVKLEDYTSFVVADIPGLIEGAHRGVGLGFQFLRHVERTSILLHLVDISETSDDDPVENFEKITRELEMFSPELIKKPQAVAGTKMDIAGSKERCDRLESYCRMNKIDFFPVSAATGSGIRELVAYLAIKIEETKDSKK